MMKTYTPEQIQEILNEHKKWLINDTKGKHTDLRYADLNNADLRYANLSYANLSYVNLSYANLIYANLNHVNLSYANLSSATINNANLSCANLYKADVSNSDLNNADLKFASLSNANLSNATSNNADLKGTDLNSIHGLVKLIGVEPGNIYWKSLDASLTNRGYTFKLGINRLRPGENFASDERQTCSFPGFHFASKSWSLLHYPKRPYLCKIRIPMDAQINEPWATDGKASASAIEILEIYRTDTMENITEMFRK